MRLNRAIGMLIKLQINTNFNIPKTAYYSPFESHLQYGTQLWGHKNNETITSFRKLQNRALRKITFGKASRHYKLRIQRMQNTEIPRHHNLQNCLCTKSSTALNSVLLFLLFSLKISITTTLDHQQHTTF